MAITHHFAAYAVDTGVTDVRTTVTVPLNANVTPGCLVLAGVGIDKSSGAWSTTPNFTTIYSTDYSATAGHSVFRGASGDINADRPTFTWTTARMFAAFAVVFNMSSVALGTVTQSAQNNALISNGGSLSADGGASTVTGLAIAIAYADSAGASTNWGTQGDWSAGWTLAARHSGGPGTGAPGVSVAYKPVTVGDPTAVTFVNDSGADEHQLAVMTFSGTEVASAGTATTVRSITASGATLTTGSASAGMVTVHLLDATGVSVSSGSAGIELRTNDPIVVSAASSSTGTASIRQIRVASATGASSSTGSANTSLGPMLEALGVSLTEGGASASVVSRTPVFVGNTQATKFFAGNVPVVAIFLGNKRIV